jgi:hypothetical protein
MMSPWESALSSSNPEYWVAGYQSNRYGLEKIGMTGVLRSYDRAYELLPGASKIPPLRAGEDRVSQIE